MPESTRTAGQRVPLSAIALTVLFLLLGVVLILLFMLPVSPAARGFGVGPTPTLAAPIFPAQP